MKSVTKPRHNEKRYICSNSEKLTILKLVSKKIKFSWFVLFHLFEKFPIKDTHCRTLPGRTEMDQASPVQNECIKYDQK